MSKGTYNATVHCPYCGQHYLVKVDWFNDYGDRFTPPDHDQELYGLPERYCLTCGADWFARLSLYQDIDGIESLYAEAEAKYKDEEPLEGYCPEGLEPICFDPEEETRHQGPDQ